jgi:uracil-DNA glycosylase
MSTEFDAGPITAKFRKLCEDAPDAAIYPVKDFRVEWGPIFHRGRLDGTAKVLIIGQDPAQHESICRRILVGEAGQRLQGFLAKAGITKSYVMINTFLYSVYGQQGGEHHKNDPLIAAYRDKWISALLVDSPSIEVVVPLGGLAKTAWENYHASVTGAAKVRADAVTVVPIIHPTFPDSASASGQISFATAMAQLLKNWNSGLDAIDAALSATDVALPAENRYGKTLKVGDVTEIPARDLPAGTPPWMRSLKAWATRSGKTAAEKRATIVVNIPLSERPF